MRERVAAMARDTSGGWDLCEADRVALRHVVALVQELAVELTAYKGGTVDATIKAIEERMTR